MKDINIGFLKKKSPYFLIILILLLFGVALTSAEPFFPNSDTLDYDFNNIGSVNEPTTDVEELTRVLTILGQMSLDHKDGWLHFKYFAYNPPDTGDHPLHSKDGYYFTDMWYYINENGVLERLLGIRSDTNGNELQVIACGDGMCGNLSILQMGEDYSGPAIGDFAPTSRPPATAGILSDINNSQGRSISGWIEGEGDDQILFIALTSDRGENIEQEEPLVNSLVVQGFNISTGELAYMSTSLQTGDGKFELHLKEELVVFENLGEDTSIEERYIQVMTELLEGK